MAANTSIIKAMYPIVLKNDGRTDREKNDYNVNQERLNANFKEIASEIVRLWESGERNLNFLSARISEDESQWTALGQQVTENTSTIIMLPSTIISQVATVIREYVDNGEGQDPDELTQAIASMMTQEADSITASFQQTFLDQDGRLQTIESWFRVVAGNAGAGTNPGAIIGRSDSDTSFKAEATCIYFYRGDDNQAKWVNALAGLDANGNFVAGVVHVGSLLIDDLFDVDVVAGPNNIEFLHIIGR